MPVSEVLDEPCPECGGRGWVVVSDGRAGTARPCACREHDVVPRLIEEAGLKGLRVGGAEITRRHANIIVNRGGATAADVRALIARAQEEVERRTGYRLLPEISFVGELQL